MSAPPSALMNRLWADLIVDELVRNGLDFFCLAPGARSAPLAMAVAAHPEARHVMHFDERGTAFLALGYGKATRSPAVWITTSGTAVANGFPAVIEAATEAVPMLLLTADRPPELRETGANQTIDQVKIFGSYVRWFFDLPAPTAEIDPQMVLTTVDQAAFRARRIPAGPVHLNCMFREPLVASPGDYDPTSWLKGLVDWQQHRLPYTQYALPPQGIDEATLEPLWDRLRKIRHGLIVAGKVATLEQGQAILRLAQHLQWPLLPDVGSQLRLGEGQAPCIPWYDQLLADPSFGTDNPPEAVLHLGGRVLSKRLSQYLAAASPATYIVVQDTPFRLDPDHRVTHRIACDVTAFCTAMIDAIHRSPHTPDTTWMARWAMASRRTGERLRAYFEQQETMSEPLAAWLLSRLLPKDHALMLSSSMPIRDMDMFADENSTPVWVASNRGASGIDGIVATAAGIAAARKAPVTLLIGDLALLHDLNALALVKEHPVVVVVLNNHGGGIFHFLPVAAHDEVFEPFFGTPHTIRFEAAARLFDLAYFQVEASTDFISAYRQACEQRTSVLIEITTSRQENVALHRQLLAYAIDVDPHPPLEQKLV